MYVCMYSRMRFRLDYLSGFITLAGVIVLAPDGDNTSALALLTVEEAF